MAGNVVIRPVGRDERAAWAWYFASMRRAGSSPLTPSAETRATLSANFRDGTLAATALDRTLDRGRPRACVAHNHNGNLAEYPFKKVPKQFLERRDAPFVFSQRNNERRRKHEEDFLRSRRPSDHRGCGAYS